MEIKHLPGGGKNFSSVKFSSRLRDVTKYTGLKDSYKTVAKVVSGSAGAIRSGRFNEQSAWKKVKMSEKGLAGREERDIKKIFKYLATSQDKVAAKGSSNIKSTVARSVRINRDPNNQLDMSGLKIQVDADNNNQGGLSGSSYSRGEVMRAERKYDRMSKLGSGVAARALQKSAFSELQSRSSGRLRPTGPGLAGGSGMTSGPRRLS